jgi:hypothetical protein
MRVFSSLLVVVILGSCATTTTTRSVSHDDWLGNLASEQVGKDATIERNNNQSFALCWSNKVNPSNNMPVLQFVIVRMSDHKVVEQGAVTMGSIKWISDYDVEVSHAPDQVVLDRGNNTTIRTINVKKYLDVVR